MELRDYLRVLHKHWALILIVTLLGVAAAAGASILMKPKFEANTQLYVSVRGESQGVGDLAQGSTLARQSVSTYATVVKTESVLGPVIKKLGLDMTSEALSEQVQASAPLNQSIVQIAVTGDDAVETAEIANAVGQSLKTVVEEQLEASSEEGQPSLVSLNTVQPAAIPESPISPRVPLNLALGALLGLALGLGIAMLRSVLDTRIHSAHDVEQATEAPLLGGITFDPDASKRPLIVHADPRSPRAESFRILRTNLQFLAVSDTSELKGRSFVISSAGLGEGKSTTAANLAIALSQSGLRVALVDGDLRLPKVAEYMGLEGGAGLTDVLIGRAEITEVLQRWGRDQLFVLPAGKVPPNPSELLGSKAMDELLKQMMGHFDYVIVDAPPLLLVTDAAVLSKRSNGVLLVAASGSTKKAELASAVRSLSAAGGTLQGVIVTMLPTKGPDSYGYGAYGAYGGYGDSADVTMQTGPTRVLPQRLARRARASED